MRSGAMCDGMGRTDGSGFGSARYVHQADLTRPSAPSGPRFRVSTPDPLSGLPRQPPCIAADCNAAAALPASPAGPAAPTHPKGVIIKFPRLARPLSESRGVACARSGSRVGGSDAKLRGAGVGSRGVAVWHCRARLCATGEVAVVHRAADFRRDALLWPQEWARQSDAGSGMWERDAEKGAPATLASRDAFFVRKAASGVRRDVCAAMERGALGFCLEHGTASGWARVVLLVLRPCRTSDVAFSGRRRASSPSFDG